MIFKKMLKNLITIIFFIFLIVFSSSSFANNSDFNLWINDFKKKAISSGISKNVVDDVMSDARFLAKVIEYDRYQPEFYEDTFTYIKKRTNAKKVKKGLALYKKEKLIIDKIDKKFLVEKELLLALMGIETNFGKYLGKMDIISSLATLSFDKRRSDFFTKELLIILKLIDNRTIDPNSLRGSWAGAFGNFQFMPRTIQNYAIDYDSNEKIELKSIDDSFASAANYINKIGWKKNAPCFYEVKLKENVPIDILNTSAKKIKNKKKISYLKKYISDHDLINVSNDDIAAIITPDKDIVPNSSDLYPAYLVFNNYELILKWNRSLRFALAVCTLKDKFNNDL